MCKDVGPDHRVTIVDFSKNIGFVHDDISQPSPGVAIKSPTVFMLLRRYVCVIASRNNIRHTKFHHITRDC